MSLLYIADSAYIGVQDVSSATSWYMEKLGLQRVVVFSEEEGCVSLAFSKRDTVAIILGPSVDPNDVRDSPMLYTTNIEKARALLISRGVRAGPIEVDRQGTHYFSMRDVEGNDIEITEEP